MKLLVVSTAPILTSDDVKTAYAPMVAELDLWFEKPEAITILAPTQYSKPLLTAAFKRQDIKVISVPSLYFGSLTGLLKSIMGVSLTKLKLLFAMAAADHIHIRCPGNTSLLACWLQMLFPWKNKTAKYAGNWSADSKQPFSYKMQKWLLSNTFLTRKMKVMVYGDWPKQTGNIKPFFTATYWEEDKKQIITRDYSRQIKMAYLGTLSANKRVDYAIDLTGQLIEKGIDISLDIYGDGIEAESLQNQIGEKNLTDRISLKGNQPANLVAQALQQAHFLILPSKSEGWPKAVAEAMFWGAIPLASPVSCVPWMLDEGKRGLLLDFKTDADTLEAMLSRPRRLERMANSAIDWSRVYTMDKFRDEIHKLLQG